MIKTSKDNLEKTLFKVTLNEKYKDVTCPRCNNTWQEYYTGNTILIKECNYCHAKYKVIPDNKPHGFIANVKSFMNYNNLPTKRKIRFWIMLPLVFLNKLIIKKMYRKYL